MAATPSSEPTGAEDRPDIWLLIGLVVMLALAAVLSRQARLPEVFGVQPERLEPSAHVFVSAAMTIAMINVVRRWIRLAVLAGFGVVLLFTTTAELGQASLLTRSTSSMDLLANTIGGVLGVTAVLLVRRFRPSRERVLALTLTAAVICVQSWAVVADVPLGQSCQSRVSLSPFEEPPPASQPELVGFTYDLSKPGGALELGAREAQGGPTLLPIGLGQIESTPEGVVFVGPEGAALQSLPAGRRITDAVRQNGSVLVTVMATPSALPRGPVPIVAISNGLSPSDLNIHVGQHGDELSVRLRLGCGRFNWTRVDDVFAPGVPRHIVVRFADRTQQIWVDGTVVDERRFEGESANPANWSPALPLLVGNEPMGDQQFLGRVDFVSIGLAR